MKYLAPGLLALTLLAGGPVVAQDQTGAGIKLAKKNCTCRFMGKKFGLGVMVCIKTPNGPRLARCELNLNNTSWKTTSSPCHIAGMPRKLAALDMCTNQGVL